MGWKSIPAWLRSPLLLSKKNPPSARHAARLLLERLEDRNVPSVPANEAYVASLFQGLLGRGADAIDFSIWAGQLNTGATPSQVALGIESSEEFSSRTVQIYYQVFLGRTADIAGLDGWLQWVQQGASLDEVKANILGSDEFFAKNGGTMSSYLNALYQDELGRPVDAVGLASWLPVTPNNGAGRAATAILIRRSTEGDEKEITSIYETVLGRLPDPGGEANWLGLFQHGQTDLQITADILGSGEYFATIEGFAATASDPNVAAQQFIVDMHRFDATLPGAEQLNATIGTNPSLVLPPPPPPPHHHHRRGTTGVFTTGPIGTTGFTGGGFTGGGFTSGGFTGGGFTGGGSTGGFSGGSGGASGSLRAAAPQDGNSNGGMQGVGGRGQGSGLYLASGLLALPNPALTSGMPQLTNQQPPSTVPIVPLAVPSNVGQPLMNQQPPSPAPVVPLAVPFNVAQPLTNQQIQAQVSAASGIDTEQLTNQQLQTMVSAALVRLEEGGIKPALLGRLESYTYEVGPLPGSLLGYTFAKSHKVVINPNADGYGWFVDPTPLSNDEFVRNASGALVAIPGGPAAGRMDLETVVLHEMGHVAGFQDVNSQTYSPTLMEGTLPPGERQIDGMDEVFSGFL